MEYHKLLTTMAALIEFFGQQFHALPPVDKK
jgi:hypothetical protein